MTLRRFYDLREHPARRARVDEGDAGVADPDARLGVDQLDPSVLELAEGVVDVLDGVGDVIEPGPALGAAGPGARWPRAQIASARGGRATPAPAGPVRPAACGGRWNSGRRRAERTSVRTGAVGPAGSGAVGAEAASSAPASYGPVGL